MSKPRVPLDRLAMGLSIAGIILGILTAVVGRLVEEDFSLHGYGIFVGFSLAAIVLGILTRAWPLGKAAAITSSVLLLGSVIFLA